MSGWLQIPTNLKPRPSPTDKRQLWISTLQGTTTTLKTLLGPTTPVVSGGIGGWEEIARPKRQAMTNYKGTPLWSVKIEIIMDGFATGESIEGEIVTLVGMASKWAVLGSPPFVTYQGGAPGAGGLWVIQDVAWGDAIRRSSDGLRVRQFATITFLEYAPPAAMTWSVSGPANDAQARHDAESAAAAAAASRQAAQDAANLDPAGNPAVNPGGSSGGSGGGGSSGLFSGIVGQIDKLIHLQHGIVGGIADEIFGGTASGGGGGGTYTVRSGDTLSAIAAAQLGNSNRWQEIASLNGVNDPRSLRVGQVLRMPGASRSTAGRVGVT